MQYITFSMNFACAAAFKCPWGFKNLSLSIYRCSYVSLHFVFHPISHYQRKNTLSQSSTATWNCPDYSYHPSMHPTRPNQVIIAIETLCPPPGIHLLNNVRELALTRWLRGISARDCTKISIAFRLWLSLKLKWPVMGLLNKVSNHQRKRQRDREYWSIKNSLHKWTRCLHQLILSKLLVQI